MDKQACLTLLELSLKSYARGDATPESDIDILIELDGQASLLDFIGTKLELEDVLGRRVDLVQYAAIKPRLRDRILSEEVPILMSKERSVALYVQDMVESIKKIES